MLIISWYQTFSHVYHNFFPNYLWRRKSPKIAYVKKNRNHRFERKSTIMTDFCIRLIFSLAIYFPGNFYRTTWYRLLTVERCNFARLLAPVTLVCSFATEAAARDGNRPTEERQRPRCCSKVNLMREVSVRYWSLLTEGAEPATIWLFYLTSPEHEATFAYVVNTPVSPLASPWLHSTSHDICPTQRDLCLIISLLVSTRFLSYRPYSFFNFALSIHPF